MLASYPQNYQYVMDPAHIAPSLDPIVITGLAWNQASSTPSLSTSSLVMQIGYLNPSLVPPPGGDYTLNQFNLGNFEQGTNSLVYEGAFATGGGYGYTIQVPFDAPFVYDPKHGPLVISMTHQGFMNSNGQPASTGASSYFPTLNASHGKLGASTIASLFPQTRFETSNPNGTTAGSYTSPSFPAPDQGNVIRWGRAVASSTVSDADDNVTINVVTPAGAIVLRDIIPDGTGAYDLSSISPLQYPELQLQAQLSGNAGACMTDLISPFASFSGYSTGLNNHSNVIGFQDRDPTSSGDFADDNQTAWVWQKANSLLADLHPFLPIQQVEGTPPVDLEDVWFQSFASDINSANTIVGWADPNTDDVGHVPDSCLLTQAGSAYAPVGSDRKQGNSNLELGGRQQWVITEAELGGKPGAITSLYLRDDGGAGNKTLGGVVTVRLGYANPQGLGDSFAANFHAGYDPETVVSQDGLSWNQPQNDPLGFNVPIVFNQVTSFAYDPDKGDLLVEMIWTGTASGVIVFDGDGCTGGPTTRYVASEGFDEAFIDVARTCPITTKINGTSTRATETQVVWKPHSSAGVPVAGAAIDDWQAACLPFPDQLNTPQPYSDKNLPRVSLVHVNEAGNIAATVGIERTTPGARSTLGTATVWCPDPLDATGLGYEAHAIEIDNGEGSTMLAPPALVTGFNDGNTVIGVAYGGGQGDLATYAIAFRPTALDAGCPSEWEDHNLTSSLVDYLEFIDPAAPEPTRVVPLDVDDQGNIVGIYAAPDAVGLVAYHVVLWTYFDGGYTAGGVSPAPVPNAILAQALGSDKFPNYISRAATRSLFAGRVYFTDYDGPFEAWTYQDGALTQIPSLTGSDYITGAGGTTALGLGGDGENNPIEAWASFDGDVAPLGRIADVGNHVPLFTNADKLVIGNYPDPYVEDGARVFKWRACSLDTPSLDEWSVTYETDRPPEFTFEVTVDDFCQPQITNKVDISTSTPEITAENNHSEASIPLNTADLAVEVTASAAVVSPAEGCDGFCPIADDINFVTLLTNEGPGVSRDVVLSITPPDGFQPFGDPQFDGTLVAYTEYVDGNFTIHFNAFQPGDQFEATWYGESWLDEPGSLLTSSATVDARTVDCNGANDTGSIGVVVGDFANLWVTIAGPAFATAGETLTYTITYGNSGNTSEDDANVTFQPPPGTTFISADVTPTSTAPYPLWDVASLGDPLAPDEIHTIVVTLSAPACDFVGDGGVLLNLANITGRHFDPLITDNDAVQSTFIAPASGGLALDVVTSHTIAESGEVVATTVYFQNSGTNPVGGATLRVGVPGGATRYVSGSASPNASFFGGTIKWDLGTLLSGEAGSVTFRYVYEGGREATSAVLDAIGACGTSVAVEPPDSSICACPPDYEPNPSEELCVLELSVQPTVSTTQHAVCAALPLVGTYSATGARFLSSTTPGNLASDQAACTPATACVSENTVEWQGRLNAVGVWACTPGSVPPTAGAAPIGQWIGFSKCITIAAAGDYLVGIAGDNHVLLRLDGQLVYQSASAFNFRTWNVFRVSLTAGAHNMELFGKNDEGPASFGAEISGPFAVGSIDTPTAMAAADYAANIVFSTVNERGGSFDTSLNASTPSGMTCPAGYALDLCGAAPSCTSLTEAACEEPDAPGLNVFKSASQGTACGAGGGEIVGWSILVTNTSSVPISGVTVTDPLTTGMAYMPGTIGGVGASALNPNALVWTVGTLAANSSVTLTYDTRVTATATGVLTNAATVTSLPANGTGITANGAIGIDCAPTATISKSWPGSCELDGEPVTVSLLVTNTSQNTAISRAKLSDSLPEGMDIVLPSGSPIPPGEAFSYNSSTRTVTFDVASILPGESFEYSFGVMVNGLACGPGAHQPRVAESRRLPRPDLEPGRGHLSHQ